MFEIVRSKEVSIQYDFVAIGNIIDKAGVARHSGFVIKYGEQFFDFDFNGSLIEFKPLSKEYFHIYTATISPNEVPSFIAQCKNILKKANPQFGYFYSGESYDPAGNHHSNSPFGEAMTCVGFCLNVLKEFLDTDYIQYEDWTDKNIYHSDWLWDYVRIHGIDEALVRREYRRISPIELLASAFFNQLPISKKSIDSKIGYIEDYFKRKASVSGKK